MTVRQIIAADGWRALYMVGPLATDCELVPLVAWALGEDHIVRGLVIGADGLVGDPDMKTLASYLPPHEPIPQAYRLEELWDALAQRGERSRSGR